MSNRKVYVLKQDTRVAQYHPVPEDIENWLTLDHDGSNLRGKMYDVDNETWVVATKTDVQLKRVFREQRAEAVSKIIVEVDGMFFDGDEVSQDRMTRAIESMAAILDSNGNTIEPAVNTIIWVLNNNVPTEITKIQLQRARRAAGIKQSLLWTP